MVLCDKKRMLWSEGNIGQLVGTVYPWSCLWVLNSGKKPALWISLERGCQTGSTCTYEALTLVTWNYTHTQKPPWLACHWLGHERGSAGVKLGRWPGRCEELCKPGQQSRILSDVKGNIWMPLLFLRVFSFSFIEIWLANTIARHENTHCDDLILYIVKGVHPSTHLRPPSLT